jgi:hypothetical protein
MDLALETDYDNFLPLNVDAAIVQTEPAGRNDQLGDHNLQENRSILAPAGETMMLQSLTGNSFSFDVLEFAHVNNAVSLEVTASGPITDNVGINAAAGAFNLQANSSVLAVLPAVALAESAGDVEQNAQLNNSVLTDVANDVMTTIILEDVTVNVGVNSVSGIGNEQLNLFTVTTSSF